MNLYKQAAHLVDVLDDTAVKEAEHLQGQLTKPLGSLGKLEVIGNRLAGIARRCPPPIPMNAHVVIFAADHGVHEEGVSPWPQEVTAQMVGNFLEGGAAINVIARTVGAAVTVVDAGVATPISSREGLISAPIAKGTQNLAKTSAMSVFEAEAALDLGVEVADNLIGEGVDLIVLGDMGIANTTVSATLIAQLVGVEAPSVTGRGTGIDDSTFLHKAEVIRRALERISEFPHINDDPVRVLAEIGGFEIGAIAGLVLGAASKRVPIVIDGVIATAGALLASTITPLCSFYCFAGHLSVEPAAKIALDHMGLDPILDLSMRLGEGTGAALAIPIIQASARILSEMATFSAAGVSSADEV